MDAATTAQLLTEMVTGDLVTATADGLLATFLPLVWVAGHEPHGSLVGHLARLNEQWCTPPDGQALVIGHGPDAYVSPNWYASKARHGRVVPTWNYVALHVYGSLLVHEEPEWIKAAVERVTQRHESGRPQAWQVDDAPSAFVAGQLKAIVGIELAIDRVEVKVKMSQNRPPADIDGVVSGLVADGRADVAEMVTRMRPEPT